LNWVEAFLMMSVVAVLVAIVFALRSGDVNIPSSMHFLCGAKLHIPFIGMLYHLESGTIKVMWSTFQIVQSISFNLSVNYPDPYSSIISYFSFFELDFLSVDCFKGGYLLSVLIATVVPILVALICWVVYLFRLVYFNALSFSEIDGWDSQSKQMFAQHVHASLLIIYVFVPPVANKQFKALDCQDLADGQSFLRADTSVDCNSVSYHNFVIMDSILIGVYQCLPLLYVALLFRVRHKLNPIAANKELALQIRDEDESLHAIKVYM
jgi:hypothetical protein